MKNKRFIYIFIAILLIIAAIIIIREESLEKKILPKTNSNQTEKADLIVVDSPQPNTTVKNTFTISGRARGTWYFEAVFPIVVLDSSGKEIGNAQARATDDWMTENFVPFTAELKLTSPYSGKATLVLKKDNPSGEAERDDALKVPIMIVL